MATRTEVTSSDLFVLLEKAFRKRLPGCGGCTFSMPWMHRGHAAPGDDWQITLTNACSPRCLAVLEEIVSRYRREYALTA